MRKNDQEVGESAETPETPGSAGSYPPGVIPAQPYQGINLAELPHHDPQMTTALEESTDWSDEDRDVIKHIKGTFARKMREPGADAFTIRPEMRTKYGIGEKETPCWKLNPKVGKWNELQGNQSLDHWLASVPGGRIITFKDEQGRTQNVTAGDTILCCYDSRLDAAYNEIKAEQQANFLATQLDGDMEIPDREGGTYTISRYRESEGEIAAMKQDAMRQLHHSGFIGEFAGQDMETVLSALGAEKCAAIAASYRGGNTQEEVRDEPARDRGNSSYVSIPKNVRPRNFAGAKK